MIVSTPERCEIRQGYGRSKVKYELFIVNYLAVIIWRPYYVQPMGND